MRARGLKLKSSLNLLNTKGVAPHAGAWIETPLYPQPLVKHMSRPMRARGLKQGFS